MYQYNPILAIQCMYCGVRNWSPIACLDSSNWFSLCLPGDQQNQHQQKRFYMRKKTVKKGPTKELKFDWAGTTIPCISISFKCVILSSDSSSRWLRSPCVKKIVQVTLQQSWIVYLPLPSDAEVHLTVDLPSTRNCLKVKVVNILTFIIQFQWHRPWLCFIKHVSLCKDVFEVLWNQGHVSVYHMCTLSLQGDISQNLFPIDEKKPKLAFDSAEDYERYATFHMCFTRKKLDLILSDCCHTSEYNVPRNRCNYLCTCTL